MMRPMTKKLLLGIPTVTLSAVLACTVAGCGGSAPSGSPGGSGGSAPVQEKPRAYDSQTVEVAGITYESVAHGTFYRGDAKLQDGFYLHIKITNNNTKNRTFSSFNVHAAQGDLEAGDPLFTSGKAAVLDYVASEAPDELHEGIDLSERPDIGPGETVEYVYFWAPKTAYYGPITVEFVDAYAPAKNHEAMHFDTTGCETKEFKAAGGVADSGEKADLTGIDCASYSIEAARWVHAGFVRRRARKGKLLPRRDWRTPEHQHLPALAGGRGCKPRAGLRRQGDNNRPGRVQRHNVAALYRSRQRPYTVCDGSRNG